MKTTVYKTFEIQIENEEERLCLLSMINTKYIQQYPFGGLDRIKSELEKKNMKFTMTEVEAEAFCDMVIMENEEKDYDFMEGALLDIYNAVLDLGADLD